MGSSAVLTASPARARADWAKDASELQSDQGETDATIEEPCIRCGNPEVYYYTMQLRSVDEGSTVFYSCPKCKHKWKLNN